MKKDFIALQERIKNIQGIYDKLDKLCDYIPEIYVKEIKRAVLGDEELKNLIHSMDNYRAPRILLVGRTGFGKSSLINAMLGKYTAEVSDVESCTLGTSQYTYHAEGGVPIEILDTRGIAESVPLDEAQSAENQILESVLEFDPDVALFVLSCASRDGIDRDIAFMKSIRKSCYQKNAVELPMIVAVNKADSVAPSRETIPYSQEKLKNIEAIRRGIQNMLFTEEVKVNGVIPVSSCIDWMDDQGNELKTAEQLNYLTPKEREALTISFDGRFRIKELIYILEKSITNAEANMGIKLAFHLDQILEKIADKFVDIFMGIAAVLVGVSLPVADYVALVALESLLVAIIMALSGREMSMDSAKEFIAALSGTAAAGVALREVARMAVKFVPVGGNVISAGIASAGVKMIGDAAIAFYIKGMDMEEVKKQFRRESRKEKAKVKGESTLKKLTSLIGKKGKK